MVMLVQPLGEMAMPPFRKVTECAATGETRRKEATRPACHSFVQIICLGRVRIEPHDRPCSAGVVVGEVQRACDGTLSNGTPDWRPATHRKAAASAPQIG
jgi:hypothetical protein